VLMTAALYQASVACVRSTAREHVIVSPPDLFNFCAICGNPVTTHQSKWG
jgi:hypothetical protein